MSEEVEDYIEGCGRCLHFKSKMEKAPLNPIQVVHPLELIHMDYLTITLGKGDKDINILVLADHFIHYAQAYITPTQKAAVVTKTLWEKFLVHYGLPEKILMDQGCNFESNLVKELCNLGKVKKLHTTPYRLETNGQCEHFNSTLITMLGTLPPESKQNWPQMVSPLIHAYNCSKSNATSFSPYYLIYERHPLLPLTLSLT